MPPLVAVVTDSTAYLPAEAGVTVVPIHVIADGVTYREDAPQLGRNALARARTSQPGPYLFLDAYRRLAAAGHTGIVSIHLSGDLSGTVSAAATAAAETEIPVEVIDSRSIAMGLGYPVLAAARTARAGGDLPAVATAARRCAATTRTYFYVETLDQLRRSGRIGTTASLLGSALMIKPLLQVADGRITLLEKVRTAGRALARLEDLAVQAAVAAGAEEKPASGSATGRRPRAERPRAGGERFSAWRLKSGGPGRGVAPGGGSAAGTPPTGGSAFGDSEGGRAESGGAAAGGSGVSAAGGSGLGGTPAVTGGLEPGESAADGSERGEQPEGPSLAPSSAPRPSPTPAPGLGPSPSPALGPRLGRGFGVDSASSSGSVSVAGLGVELGLGSGPGSSSAAGSSPASDPGSGLGSGSNLASTPGLDSGLGSGLDRSPSLDSSSSSSSVSDAGSASGLSAGSGPAPDSDPDSGPNPVPGSNPGLVPGSRSGSGLGRSADESLRSEESLIGESVGRGSRVADAVVQQSEARRIIGGADGFGVVSVAVQHLGAPERANDLARRLRERISGAAVQVVELGTVIGAHVGPRLLGVTISG